MSSGTTYGGEVYVSGRLIFGSEYTTNGEGSCRSYISYDWTDYHDRVDLTITEVGLEVVKTVRRDHGTDGSSWRMIAPGVDSFVIYNDGASIYSKNYGYSEYLWDGEKLYASGEPHYDPGTKVFRASVNKFISIPKTHSQFNKTFSVNIVSSLYSLL